MTDIDNFKYKDEIKNLIVGIVQLPELFEPNNLDAFRFAFSESNENEHLPVYKQNPQRVIQERDNGKISTSGLALSCFDKEESAENKFRKITKNIKNFSKTAGDSIAKGTLQIEHGKITKINQNTRHFDLYEFSNFNANKCFTIIKNLT